MLGVACVAAWLAVSAAAAGRRGLAYGTMLVAAGGALNFIVICANGGRMPIDSRGRPGYDGYLPAPGYEGYAVMNRRTRLRYLGDWINVGRGLVSPGDVCIVAGVVIVAVSKLLLKT